MTKSDHSDTLSKIDVGTTATWRAAGISRAQLASLVRSGELVRIRYGSYATASILAAAKTNPRLSHALLVAAATGAAKGGVASHDSAALMYGFDLLRKPSEQTVTLTMPPQSRTGRYDRAGVIRHIARLPAEHVTKVYGLRVTTAARTVTDIARTATFMEGVVTADSALHGRHTSKTELRAVLASCRQWPGIARARRVVDFSSAQAESVLESCARVILHEQGLPPPEQQVNVIGRSGRFIARVDFLWRKFWTVGEADGLAKYTGRQDAIAQLKRDRLLRDAGYEVVHFTWQELFSDPAGVTARIRAGFDRAVRLGL